MFNLTKSQDIRLLHLSGIIVHETDKGCVICNDLGTLQIPLHRHHCFYGAMRSVWILRYDPLYSVSLCIKCHEHSPDSPHQNNNLFMDKLLKKLPQSEKREAIIRYINKPPCIKLPFPGYKLLVKEYKDQIKALQQDWENETIESEYAGREVEETRKALKDSNSEHEHLRKIIYKKWQSKEA